MDVVNYLRDCLIKLANDDQDYATEKNNIGFKGSDSSLGHTLASQKRWNFQDMEKALKICTHYKNTQLKYEMKKLPEILSTIKGMDNFQRYTQEEIEDLISVIFVDVYPRWVSKVSKFVRSTDVPKGFWEIWSSPSAKATFKSNGVGVSTWRGEWQVSLWSIVEYPEILNEKLTEEIIGQHNLIKESELIEKQKEEELLKEKLRIQKEIDNFKPARLKPEIKEKLFEYQYENCGHMVRAIELFGVFANSSDTGTGKTYSTLGGCKQLGLKPFIICPKAVIPAWRKALKHFEMDALAIVNYELIRIGKQLQWGKSTRRKRDIYGELNYYETVKKEISPYFRSTPNPRKHEQFQPKRIMEWNLPEDAIVIFDEAHRGKNRNTMNSQLFISAKDSGAKICMLSATIAENPLKLFGTGKCLGLWDEPWSFYSFIQNYGCDKIQVNRYGQMAWQFVGDYNDIYNLKELIGNKMAGMDVDVLRKQGKFPRTKIITDEIYFNGATDKIQAQYQKIMEIAKGLGKKADYYDLMELHLSKLQKELQQAELLKVPTIAEMIEDELENKNSIAVFLNYTESLKQLELALQNKNISSVNIYGGNSGAINEQNRLKFQNNKVHVIICNIQASREGIDLHDVLHERKRISFISPCYNAQDLKQVLGRIDRAGGTTSIQKILIAEGTIEREVMSVVMQKIKHIEILNEAI